jgi:hypothetical protein
VTRFGGYHRASADHQSQGILDGRRLWEVGSWGNASDQIGHRWEVVGLPAVRARLPLPLPDADGEQRILPLVQDAALQAGLKSLGMTNPDAILIERLQGRLILRPVDFKWSIETASYKQISGAALSGLIWHERSPLPVFLGEAEGGGPLMRSHIETADGLFVAPDSQPNRRFIGSAANHRQEYPIQSADIVWQVVSGRDFFGALPWWWLAELLATRDHSLSALDSLEGAERYYRLGAGLGGALSRTNTPVFAEESPDLDVAALVADFLTEHPAYTSEAAIAHLQPQMAQRQSRTQRLRSLWQCPYGFPEMASDLLRQGIAIPDADNGSRAERERWGAVHRRIADAHRGAINDAGLALVTGGMSEGAALAALDKRRSEFAIKCRANARRIVGEEMARARA